MATKTMTRTSLRPIVTEINNAKRQLVEREREATTAVDARRLRARIKKLDRLSSMARGICRGFFV